MNGGGEVKLFIASPSYSSSYCHEYVESLVATIKDLQQHGIKSAYKSLAGMHWIDIARDVLAHIFLHTDCSHMLQIDADLGWESDAPRRMLAKNKEIIGGAYPIKSDLLTHYPVGPGLPGGFLMVSREVIEVMTASRRPYEVSTLQFGKLNVAPLFTREMRADGYTGEDFMFCKRASEAGYELEIEADIDFLHVGPKAWRGNFSQRAAND